MEFGKQKQSYNSCIHDHHEFLIHVLSNFRSTIETRKLLGFRNEVSTPVANTVTRKALLKERGYLIPTIEEGIFTDLQNLQFSTSSIL